MQKAFLGASWFIKVMNVYYGTLHFIITGGLLMWVYLRRHEHYRQYRNLLGMTTALALIGYFAFPLAPPRMYPCHDCFVDTLDTIGGLWSYHSSAAKAIANPFAAMPSLHFGWALWCGTLLWSFARHRCVRIAERDLPGPDAAGHRRHGQPLLARRRRRSDHLLRRQPGAAVPAPTLATKGASRSASRSAACSRAESPACSPLSIRAISSIRSSPSTGRAWPSSSPRDPTARPSSSP